MSINLNSLQCLVMIVEASREDIDIGYTWIFSISDGHKSYKRHFQFTQRLYWNREHITNQDQPHLVTPLSEEDKIK